MSWSFFDWNGGCIWDRCRFFGIGKIVFEAARISEAFFLGKNKLASSKGISCKIYCLAASRLIALKADFSGINKVFGKVLYTFFKDKAH